MKQYVIDELRPDDFAALEKYLDAKFEAGGMTGLYMKPIDPDLLTEHQASHPQCAPHYFSWILENNQLICELLVRTKARMQGDCMGYATEAQRNWIIRKADAIFDELGLIA